MSPKIESRIKAIESDLEELEVLIEQQDFLYKRITDHVSKLKEKDCVSE